VLLDRNWRQSRAEEKYFGKKRKEIEITKQPQRSVPLREQNDLA